MSTHERRITLTETDDGRWRAREEPAGRTARGETPQAALDALTGDETDEEPSAAPLYELVGLLDEDEAEHLRERSREFREGFDERVDRTHRELADRR